MNGEHDLIAQLARHAGVLILDAKVALERRLRNGRADPERVCALARDGDCGLVDVACEDDDVALNLAAFAFLLERNRERVRFFSGRARGHPGAIGSSPACWTSDPMTDVRNAFQLSGSRKKVVTEISRSVKRRWTSLPSARRKSRYSPIVERWRSCMRRVRRRSTVPPLYFEKSCPARFRSTSNTPRSAFNLCGLPASVASWSLALIGLYNIVDSLLAG